MGFNSVQRTLPPHTLFFIETLNSVPFGTFWQFPIESVWSQNSNLNPNDYLEKGASIGALRGKYQFPLTVLSSHRGVRGPEIQGSRVTSDLLTNHAVDELCTSIKRIESARSSALIFPRTIFITKNGFSSIIDLQMMVESPHTQGYYLKCGISLGAHSSETVDQRLVKNYTEKVTALCVVMMNKDLKQQLEGVDRGDDKDMDP